MEYMFLPLKRYADFEGRARRTEFFLFMLFRYMVSLFLLIIAVVVVAAMGGIGDFHSSNFSELKPNDLPPALLPALIVVGLLLLLVWAALLVPTLAVMARRFHDQNQTGWLALLYFPCYIPYLGLLLDLVVLVLMVLPGTVGPNRYGLDPKGGGEHLENVFR